jgi:hypothetical protein
LLEAVHKIAGRRGAGCAYLRARQGRFAATAEIIDDQPHNAADQRELKKQADE